MGKYRDEELVDKQRENHYEFVEGVWNCVNLSLTVVV